MEASSDRKSLFVYCT